LFVKTSFSELEGGGRSKRHEDEQQVKWHSVGDVHSMYSSDKELFDEVSLQKQRIM
jgi:hypothetical protein